MLAGWVRSHHTEESEGAADEAGLNKVHKKSKKKPVNLLRKYIWPSLLVNDMFSVKLRYKHFDRNVFLRGWSMPYVGLDSTGVMCIRGRSTIQYTAPLRLHVRQLTPYNYSKRILLLLANEMLIFLCPGYKKRLSQQQVVKRIPLGDTVIKQKIL